MKYSIFISQPPPGVIITHYRMFLTEVVKIEVVSHRLCKVTQRKGQIRARKKANYMNFRVAGRDQGQRGGAGRYSALQETLLLRYSALQETLLMLYCFVIPQVRTSSYGVTSFRSTAAKIWNSIYGTI